ncbi:MAG: Crp/Fnr family transcriptional regulator [Actinomycetota bacterium]|nr:Crp/Fnr family transcriptional regulator [Actinomycetota bacterium]
MEALEPLDRERLLAATSLISLEFKRVLHQPGEPIDTVYFPENAVVSLLTAMADGSTVEVATIGNEGIVGIPLVLGVQAMATRDYHQVQVGGSARAMDAATFLKAARRNPLRNVVQRYTQALFTQITQQVACNAVHNVTERCARWMLLTHDRVGSDEFPMTQEFLATMLAVRRASVTVAAGTLQNAGLIRYSPGRVTIVDRKGLENAACECYGVIRGEFERLFPPRPRRTAR